MAAGTFRVPRTGWLSVRVDMLSQARLGFTDSVVPPVFTAHGSRFVDSDGSSR